VKFVPTFADRGCHVVSVTDPCGRILAYLDRDKMGNEIKIVKHLGIAHYHRAVTSNGRRARNLVSMGKFLKINNVAEVTIMNVLVIYRTAFTMATSLNHHSSHRVACLD
jgi:hypothetical protein